MTSSGIKRGLAVAAISATAFSGMAGFAGSAFANTITNQQPDADSITLFNTNGVPISTKNDGTDSLVRLEAGAGSNITQVSFQIARGTNATAMPNDFVTIGTVSRNDDGAFFVEFDPANFGITQNQAVTIRARGTSSNPVLVTAGTQVRTSNSDDTTFRNDGAINTVNVMNGSALGQYLSCGATPAVAPNANGAGGAPQQPSGTMTRNAIVSGTASYQTGAVALDTRKAPTAAGAQALTTAQGNADVIGGKFRGTVDVTNFNFAQQPPAGSGNTAEADQIVVGATSDSGPTSGGTASTANANVANPGNQTEGLEAYTLFKQVVTTVTATATPGTGVADPGNVTITVLDQNKAPIFGAAVYRTTGQFVGNTDVNGQVTDSQNSAGNPTFFVDSSNSSTAANNCNGTFNAADGDVKSNTFSQSTGSTVNISSSATNGTAPVGSTVTETVTVRDVNGQPISNQTVRITRNGPDSTSQVVFRNTDNNGQVTSTFSCSQAGTVNFTAGVNDPNGTNGNFDNTATDTVQCGSTSGGGGGGGGTGPGCTPTGTNHNLAVTLKGRSKGDLDVVDVITNAETFCQFPNVRIFKVTRNGDVVQLKNKHHLGLNGNTEFNRRDRSLGNRSTTYVIKIAATRTTNAATKSIVVQ